jgi:hypothetical protein
MNLNPNTHFSSIETEAMQKVAKRNSKSSRHNIQLNNNKSCFGNDQMYRTKRFMNVARKMLEALGSISEHLHTYNKEKCILANEAQLRIITAPSYRMKCIL